MSRYNDVLIFVEDSTLQFMYVQIFNRILNPGARVQNVFGLGGRPAVIEACLRHPFAGRKPSVYIVDGDFDELNDIVKPPSPRLYRLGCYCIENLLLANVNALAEIAAESDPDRSMTEVVSKLDVGQLTSVTQQLLLPLFVVYAIVAKLDLPIETVSFSAVRLCSKQGDAETLSKKLTAARIRQVRRQIIDRVGLETYRSERTRILARVDKMSDPVMQVSGKDYLLPLLSSVLSKRFRFRDSMNSLKARLAGRFDPRADEGLRTFILDAAGLNDPIQPRV